MIVFHVARLDAAEAIDRNGFEDGTGTFLTEQQFSGVWVSDRPLVDQSGIDNPVVFEIDVADSALSDMEWIEEGKGYREWLVPAAVLNSALRRRVNAEVIRHDNVS
jgi:hypothetical protein